MDSFGPRGYPQGFPRHSYHSRPEALNEVTVRPLDAAGALAYLRARPDVIPDRIGLQGWSNGGSATISAMAPDGNAAPLTPVTGLRAALAFYPACGLKGKFDGVPFRPYAPTLVLHGTADEEVSYKRCADLVEKGRASGGDVDIKIYQGATHSFDSPGRSVRPSQPTPPRPRTSSISRWRSLPDMSHGPPATSFRACEVHTGRY